MLLVELVELNRESKDYVYLIMKKKICDEEKYSN